jgi:lipoprotein-anchoring transpeptidase ErfK/SrfK
VTLAAAVALTALTAAAPAAAVAHLARRASPTEATAPREAGEPIMAIVSLKSQQVTIYDADGWILRAPVSSGIKGRETPAGVFSVVEKDKDHHSNLYDDAWMPNMLRITWTGIALHGGPVSGHPASHGCVRMPYGFAERLFDKVGIGTRVIIAPNDAQPVEISHPALFEPKARALAAASARAEKLERAAAEAADAADEAKTAAATAARAAAPLRASLLRLGRLKTRADAELAFADKVLAAAKTDRAKARAQERKQKVAAQVATLQTQIDTAKSNGQSELDAAAAAQAAATAAETKRADTAKAAHEAKLALEPVSVFISRATQRLYVRRGFEATIDVPVKIRNPDKPIGTHVFTAVARTGTGLRWTAVTIDGTQDAKSALDRITIPQDVLDRIAPTALPRSSLVISDDPLNRETNYRTEFVVVLNDQPQGGLAMRQHPADVVARRNSRDEDGFDVDRSRDWNAPFGYARRGYNQDDRYYNQRPQGERWSDWNSPYGYARPRAGQYYNQQPQGWSSWGSPSGYARQRGGQYYNYNQQQQGLW